MKNKKILLYCFTALLSSSTLIAQTGQWKLAGNNLNGTQKLGSTNNFSLDFMTNNAKRMSLTNTGNLRFNSDQSVIQFPNPGSNPKPMMFIYESGSANTSRMVFAYSPAFSNFGLRYTLGDKIDFLGGGVSAMDIDLGNKRVGIGTTAPQSKLHVLNGSSGTAPFFQSVITAENSSNAYINLLAPKANETGILFGTSENNVSGGIVYNSAFKSSPANSLQFRTNGNEPRMVLTGEGRVGIGKTSPFAQLDIFGDNDNSVVGLLISKKDRSAAVLNNSSLFGTIQATNTVGSAILAFSTNGDGIFASTNNPEAFAGNFDGDVFTTGTYQSSDEKLKQNIHDFSSAMNIINQLHPKLYQYKKEGNYASMHLPQGDHYGLIAQDVEKLLPNLVKNTKFDSRSTKPDADKEMSSPSEVTKFKALNYTEFIPIIIKAMQELSVQNHELSAGLLAEKKQNEEQQKQIDELKAIVLKSNQSSASSRATVNALLTNASLDQNIPNPFSNSTTIRYTLPQKFTNAQLVITDMNGNKLKQINISNPSPIGGSWEVAGKGILNIDAATLSSGTYNYSLIVDGKVTDTKKMAIAK